ncbi:MAG: phosphoglycerate dehydrogenase, partial [Candidatus Lokiarchaeota archaeon]|nr:phosphoglycerate dehydrogenase [Candidatus Lokiarchaeota archaeon]
EDGINLLRYNPNFEVVVLQKTEKEKLREEIKDADAIVVRSGVKVTEELLSHTSTLRVVGRAGAGYDNIDVDACSKHGIVVMIAPGGNTNGVVELTIALMLALIRNIPIADRLMKQDTWAKKRLTGTELKGKTLGMIGLGKIGGRVAEIAQEFGMNIVALVKNKNKKRDIDFKGEFVDTLDGLLPNVDFLSLHVPLNSKTTGLISNKELDMMKPTAYLINTSRGAIVDEDALYNALKNKKIAGAAIDVYSKEPSSVKDFPFIELDNVIAMPHLGASTKESQANVSRIICENIIEGLESGIYIDAVNLPFEISATDANNYRPFIKLAKAIGKFGGQYINCELKEMKIGYRMKTYMEFKPILMTLASEVFSTQNEDISLINVKDKIDTGDVGLIINKDPDLTYNNSLKLELTCKNNEKLLVKGTFIAGIPKLVEIQNIKIEVVPAGKMLLVRNLNVPGVIGKIGTLLGERNINIAEMHLGRSEVGGETKGAVMVDEIVSKQVIDELKQLPNIVDVKQIIFD